MTAVRHAAGDFFDAALHLLEDEGFPAVTASALCDRLGVTRGSFYHHFKGFDDFIDRLLAHWEQAYSRDLIARATDADLATQFRLQTELATGLPHAAEAALRAWGTVEPRVAAAQRRVDQARHRGLAASLEQHGLAPAQADTYATIAIAVLAGMQVTQHPMEPAALRAVFDQLAQVLPGPAAPRVRRR